MIDNIISGLLQSFDAMLASTYTLTVQKQIATNSKIDLSKAISKEEAYNGLSIDLLAISHYVMGADGKLYEAEVARFNQLFSRFGFNLTAADSVKNVQLAAERLGVMKQVPMSLKLFTEHAEMEYKAATPYTYVEVSDREKGALSVLLGSYAAICGEMAVADGRTDAKEYNRIYDFLEDCRSYIDQKLPIDFRMPEIVNQILGNIYKGVF